MHETTRERLHLLAALPDTETALMWRLMSISEASAVINLYPDEISGMNADWIRVIQDVFRHTEHVFWWPVHPFASEEAPSMISDRLGIVLFSRRSPEWIEAICEAAWTLKKSTAILLVHPDWHLDWEQRIRRWATQYHVQAYRLHPSESHTTSAPKQSQCPLPSVGLVDFLNTCNRFIVV